MTCTHLSPCVHVRLLSQEVHHGFEEGRQVMEDFARQMDRQAGMLEAIQRTITRWGAWLSAAAALAGGLLAGSELLLRMLGKV